MQSLGEKSGRADPASALVSEQGLHFLALDLADFAIGCQLEHCRSVSISECLIVVLVSMSE